MGRLQSVERTLRIAVQDLHSFSGDVQRFDLDPPAAANRSGSLEPSRIR